MQRFLLVLLMTSTLIGCESGDKSADSDAASVTADSAAISAQPGTLAYPVTHKVDVVDTYHGTEVTDPYRWLEDDVRESAAVADWVAAQNRLTDSYLETLPQRADIHARLTELWNYARYSVPFTEGGRIFFSKNDGLQNQAVLYVQDSAEAEARILIDPNQWSEDGTMALGAAVPSPDGRYLAYAIQDGGSDWRSWRIMEIDSGKLLDDELHWLKFTSVSWASDSKGFYYSRYPTPEEGAAMQSLNLNQAVYFHQLNSAQSADSEVFATPEHPEWGHFAEVSEDGRWLIITTFVGTDNRYRVTVRDLREHSTLALIDHFRHDYSFIGNLGSEFYFLSNDAAPKYRIIAMDLQQPAPEHWREVVPEAEHVLVGASLFASSAAAETTAEDKAASGRLLLEYLQDAKSSVMQYALDGSLIGPVELPGIGSVAGFGGRQDASSTYFSFSSYNTPPAIYRHDIASGERSLFRQAEVDFEPEDYIVTQVFYASKDGTRVPMFIAHRRELQRNGSQPTLLYGYGGFNISLTPDFSVRWLAWMEMGGVVAVANLRGGGEYGRAWHQAGTRLNKQNVFDDFIAAAEYLQRENYTDSKHLAIMGGSNGGLLVGAVLNQRPQLFAAALPAVGVMDMLRFHRFTAGRFWTDDYGSADNAEEFAALYAYSPYHNLQPGTEYPAVLVTTADRDDRVVPGHSFKYAARLQEVQSAPAPVLIRIETRAGHGGGTATDKAIELLADQYAFLAQHLGME